MKINFQNQSSDFSVQSGFTVGNQHTTESKKNIISGYNTNREKNGIRMDLGNKAGNVNDNNFFSQGDNKNKIGKSLTELQQEAGNIDVAVAQDYRTVLSNTLSAEDYAKAEKEGFSMSSMNPEDVVTITDKIKAEVAKSGEVIVGYNDQIDDAVLAEAVGSETLARSLKESFNQADLPMTEDNINEVARSFSMAKELEAPSDDVVAYMIENEMSPTVWNFYLAENTAVARNPVSIDLDKPENKGMAEQINRVVEESGKPLNTPSFEKGFNEAKWLLNENLPVTPENIDNYEAIRSVEFPITEEVFAKASAAAISRGESPVYADLTSRQDIYTMAADLEKKYFSAAEWENSAGDLTARRQLEEIRLSMTAEVNVKLLESGFSIDTAPMEELIDALKQAEKEVALKYFPDMKENTDQAVSSYRLMNETNRVVKELSDGPAAALGSFTVRNVDEITPTLFGETSKSMRDSYEKAGESYEALMTSPRADLGDSIKKAFVNVETLVENLGMEPSEENLRAVRILGYNSMPVTVENVEKISAADEQVTSVIEKMTPASVLNMIRDGINPLETNFAELAVYFDSEQNNAYEQTAKTYSEFLYGLDMQDAISKEEREAFIGIYRLIDKIEKSDGAVIGAVVNEQAQMDFANLLKAVRTGKVKKLDVKVDEEFGGIKDIVRTGKTITEQISTAFEQEQYNEELKELRKAALVSRQAVDILDKYNLVKSADNLLSAEELLSAEGNLFDELLKAEKNIARGKDNSKLKEAAMKASESLEKGTLEEDYKDVVDDLMSLTEELSVDAGEYLDIKALSLIHRQLRVSGSMQARNEEQDYIIPVEIGDTISKVHLSFRNGADNEAYVDISAVWGEDSAAEAHFSISGDVLEGYFVGNTEEELKNLQSTSDIFVEAFRENTMLQDLSLRDIPVVTRGNLLSFERSKSSKFGKEAEAVNSDGSDRSKLMQVARLFLQSMGRA